MKIQNSGSPRGVNQKSNEEFRATEIVFKGGTRRNVITESNSWKPRMMLSAYYQLLPKSQKTLPPTSLRK